MIQSPSGPTFSFAQREDLLKSMGRSLALSRLYGASAGYDSPQYRMAECLRDAIKTLATDLTDDPYYYGSQTIIPVPLAREPDI